MTISLIVRTKVTAGRKKVDKQILYGRLRASCSLISYRRLEWIAADSVNILARDIVHLCVLARPDNYYCA